MPAPANAPKEYTVVELNHVALDVSDVAVSTVFYRDVIGLPELPRPAFDFPGAWFRLGVLQELHLIGNRDRAVGERSGHFALLVDNIDAVATRLRAAGVTFRGPKPRPDGAQQVFIADPDGNVIEFTAGLLGRDI
ncbi:MAG: VOC family protein [Cephaloticoccus sp.]|nr:VOC family protein [Cephaloticoccus sp.]MCF7759008.1 VOC family protein [Cephaloticoccus sp.]